MRERPEGIAPLPASSLAAETGKGAGRYTELGDRLVRYSKARDRAFEMAQYIAALGLCDSHGRKVLRELESCGEYLIFRRYLDSDSVRLHGMRSCRQHLICPLCAIRRGARMLSRYVERFELVMREAPHLRAFMVTLTVKNGPDLAERFEHLQGSMLRLGKTRHGKRQVSWFSSVAGAVWSYEFKRGENSGEWHPHVHMVVLAEEAPELREMCADWKDITGDSHVCEVHEMYGDPVVAFCEVFKYAVKFGDLPLADNWHAFETLRGNRLIASVGNLYGVNIPADLTDDALDEPRWVDLLFRYIRGPGYTFQGEIGTSEHQPVYETPDANPVGATVSQQLILASS